ncbi:Canalicular multispecific organic anion transporter 2 [Coemansia sp. RSA 1933]|nr:Canalicular multispecific organic anion transporter 2 [Coemansia sp. RSA 1933]
MTALYLALAYACLTAKERWLANQMIRDVFFVDGAVMTFCAMRDKTLCAKWANTPKQLLDAWPPLAERFTARGSGIEFIYDPSKRFFVLRAIARMAVAPYIPIFVAEQALNAAAHIDALLLGRILAAFDADKPDMMRVLWYVALGLIIHVVQKQAVRLRNWRKSEEARIAGAIERTILQIPLHRAALQSEHLYRYSDYHPRELAEAVFSALGHFSSLVKTATSAAMVARSMGGDGMAAAWAALSTVALRLAVRIGRLGVDWLTSRLVVLQAYDPVEEICASITSIKLYAWERKYVQWAQTYYDDEHDASVYSLPARVVRKLSHAVFEVLTFTTPHLVTLVTVQAFFASQSHSQMTNAYLLRTRMQLHLLSDQASHLVKSAIDWQNICESNRIIEFCLRPRSKPTVLPEDPETAEFAADLQGCDLTWGGDAPILRDVRLRIGHGQLVAVTGPVGQGKSSLLCALAREMEVTQGTGYSAGRIVLVPQRGFIASGQTVRDNITFGAPYDQQRYEIVVAACALGPDFARLERGDQTVVGDRGATISGGQRARIVLARALYMDADAYLLDDTLAAVDPVVARHLLEHVLLGPQALLRQKTRVLVTSSEAVLPYADVVVYVADGRIKSLNQEPLDPPSPGTSQDEQTSSSGTCQEQQTSCSKPPSSKHPVPDQTNDFLYYFRVCGWTVVALASALAIIDGVLWNWAQRMMRDVLSESQRQTLGNSAQRSAVIRYLKFDYASTALRIAVMHVDTLLSTYLTKHHCAPHINAEFIRGVVHSPLAFFSATSEPDISTAFYHSTAVVRSTLPLLLKLELINVVSLATSLHRVWLTAPTAVLVVPAVVWCNAWIDSACLSLHRTIHYAGIRLSSQSRQAWQTVTDGAAAIRGLGRPQGFVDRLNRCADNSTRYNLNMTSTLAFHDSLRCVVREAAKAAVVVVFALSVHTTPAASVSAQMMDLADSCASLIYAVELVVKIKQRMVDYSSHIRSYRRFAQLPSECPVGEQSKPDARWPDRGAIRFADYSMRYGAQMPRALDGVTLDIQAGEKIGVVGRTGAGKSSLAKALFRLVEGESGSIKIDGVDIATVGLHELRSRLAIIPQEPALFNGSVRDNLDPLHQHTIEDIWAAIIRAQLVDLINRKEVTELGKTVKRDLSSSSSSSSSEDVAPASQPLLASIGHEREERQQSSTGAHKCWRRIRVDERSPVLRSGLDKWIEFEGRNFSIGQRQLVSLCRALLRTRKILVLDEATANVDPRTDRVMHAAIGTEFRDSTVITIAHRLDTVLASSDRIVVMDCGRIVQVGAPDALLAQTDGPFARLVREFRNE